MVGTVRTLCQTPPTVEALACFILKGIKFLFDLAGRAIREIESNEMETPIKLYYTETDNTCTAWLQLNKIFMSGVFSNH